MKVKLMPGKDPFDGDGEWLGTRNPSHTRSYYAILNIAPATTDLNAIQSAIQQSRSRLESKRGFGHDEQVVEILARIDEAEITLLNPDLKREYDRYWSLTEMRRKRWHTVRNWGGIVLALGLGISLLIRQLMLSTEVRPVREGRLEHSLHEASKPP